MTRLIHWVMDGLTQASPEIKAALISTLGLLIQTVIFVIWK